MCISHVHSVCVCVCVHVCVCVCVAVNMVDPHATGVEKHFDRASNKRKYDETLVSIYNI